MKVRRIIGGALRETREFLLENSLELLPLRRHLAHYTVARLRRDLAAGVNVALLAFAQGLAFAVIAGVPPAYGITCAAVASLVGPLLASSRHTILGPTNATAFMVFSALAGLALPEKLMVLPVLVFLAGCLLVIGAYLRLADLIQYVSRTVVVGYLTGSSLLIVVNQLKSVTGLPGTPPGQGPQNFFTLLWDVVRDLEKTYWPAVAIAALTLGLYLAFKWKAPRLPTFAVVLLISSACGELARHYGLPLATLEALQPRDLLPMMPDLTDPDLWTRISPLFGVAMALAFLAALESSVMAKSLASRTGDRVDLNQEMLSVGAANLSCSILSGMPASGSLTRSALNHASGAFTQVSSMVSGLVCAGAAVALGPWLTHVPKAALGMLVICVAARLINGHHFRICMTATKSDAATLWITFAATLIVPLHIAIFIGVATSVMFYLRKAARPELVEYEFNASGNLTSAPRGRRRHPAISIVHVEGELFFGAAELFRTQIQRLAADTNLRVIILRLKNARHLDATSVMALEELVLFMRAKNRHLLISGAMKDVYRVLKNSGLIAVLGRENLFLGSVQNPNISTRNALKRAQELLGTREAEIQILYDPTKSAAGGASPA